MNYKNESNVLTLFLEGRIDSNNSEQFESEINEIRNSNSYSEIIFDTENLKYISSAGLRMVLRTRKSEPTLKIVNACSDVYDILDMTGFTEMITVEKAFRRLSVEDCEIIGKGAKGTVYRYDPETIIKVYKNPDSLPDIKNERELARKAFVLGIPTAISYDVVKVGNSFGSVFELLDAKSFSQLIAEEPEKIDGYIKLFTDLLKKIHSTEVKADDMPDIKKTVNKWIAADEPFLKPETAKKLKKLVSDVPDTLNMLHCDYHTNNIMMQNGETLLIDMDTLSHGHPVFELANIYITYVGFGEENPEIVENFIGLKYNTAKVFWEKFLPLYLETDDESKITETENKIKLLSYARLMRHTVRRGGAENEEGRKTIALCKENMEKLLDTVNTLDF